MFISPGPAAKHLLLRIHEAQAQGLCTEAVPCNAIHVCSCVDLAGEAALGQGPSRSGFIARSPESSVHLQTCLRTRTRRSRRAWLPRRRRSRRCICSRAVVHADAHGGCNYMPRMQEPAYPPKKRKAPEQEAACIVARRSSSHVKQHCAGGDTASSRSSATRSSESGLHADWRLVVRCWRPVAPEARIASSCTCMPASFHLC